MLVLTHNYYNQKSNYSEEGGDYMNRNIKGFVRNSLILVVSILIINVFYSNYKVGEIIYVLEDGYIDRVDPNYVDDYL